jgi:hypothetical protein
MSRTGNILFPPLLFASLCMMPIANSVSSQDEHEEFYKIIRTVEDILAGKNVEQALDVIGHGAGLICGTRLENLRDVVTGKVATCSLADTSFHGIMVQGRTNRSEDMGFIILKTQKSDTTKVRFHTVVFIRDSIGHFQISVWHAGDGGQ